MAQKNPPDLQLATLCRSFSLMLHAGISLADSAFLLATEEDAPLLKSLGEALDQGIPLSQAL